MSIRSLLNRTPFLGLALALLASASVASAAPTASRSYPYPNYEVGDTATLTITTSPAQPNASVYRWRYRNGSPDGAQPTIIGTTDANGRYTISLPLPSEAVGVYTSERFAVGSSSNPRSNTLSYRIDASNAPSVTRPWPYPTYDVGDTARLELSTSPPQPYQPVYRWRYRNGSPDGAQPTEIGTTDGDGVLIVEGVLGVAEIGDYSGERFAVGTTTGPRSPSRSYAVHADDPPNVARPAPYPSYVVGDFAVMQLTTIPSQPGQPVYRWRLKDGQPDGLQPTHLGTTDAYGRLTVSGTLASGEIGTYTGERFAVGTTGGPRSPSLSFTVTSTPTVAAPIVSRSAPYPDYQVGDLATLDLSTNPVQANQAVYRWRLKNGQPDGVQPAVVGTTDQNGRLTISGTLTSGEVGLYSGERFAVGNASNPRSAALAYNVAPTPTAPTVSRPAPFPDYRVGDVAALELSTVPAQPYRAVYRWRYKDGAPDGAQPTEIGTTDQDGRLVVSGVLTEAEIGSYTQERFAVGRATSPRSPALAYTVSEALPPEPPIAYRPAPFPNYRVGDEATLILTTDPPQREAPVYRYRMRDNLPDGDQPTYIGKTDAAGRFESRAVLPVGSEGFYSDERFAVGSPSHPTSTPLSYSVLDPTVVLAAPTVTRDAPFPTYSVGDVARMVLTTDPVQPNQPVFRWRQKDGEDDGAQPTLIGTTNSFGRLTVEATLPAESAGSYTGEQFAVGSPEGERSPALAYTVAPVASGELVLSSVEPTDFDSGGVTIATLRGAGFSQATDVELEAAAAPFVDTRVLDVSADGTEMTVEVDATRLAADSGGVTMIFATEGAAQKAQPVRFVKEGPVIDVWTPTVPYSGSTFVLTLLGHHLSGVSVAAENPGVLSVRVMATSDRRVFGLVTVADGAPEGWQRLWVTRGGKTTFVDMYVLPARDPAVQEQNVLEGSTYAEQAKAAGDPVPELLVQAVGINPELVQQSLDLEQRAAKSGFTFTFSVTWRLIYPIFRETITFDVDTGQVGEIARVLGIGEQLNLGAFTFSLTGELYIHFEWQYNSDFGWSPPRLCVEVLIAAEVPGATRTVTFSGCWVFGGGSGQSPGFTSMANVQGGDCAEAVTADIVDGIGFSTVTQTDCCPQPLDVRMAGQTFGLPFDEIVPDVGETQPEPDCRTTPTCSELQLSVDAIDAQFAPSAERLDIVYTIWSEEFGAPTFTKMEVFANGGTSPIFVHETLPANVIAADYVGPDGVAGWDGKDSSGQWIHPKDGPFTVRISASESSDYADACVTEATFEVAVHSIEVTPTGPQKLIKPNTGATEVDKLATATVLLKDKSGAGVATEVPIDIEWSFEDPDDTSNRMGIDPNGMGDDNAPIMNGGKRVTAGGQSTLWKAAPGHPMTLMAQGQKAEMTTRTSGSDKGKAEINFSASKIAGDNYILVAKTRNLMPEVDGRSDTWTVRKMLQFGNAYRMPGGADVDAAMATANVNPAFSADGHTDYTLQGVSAPATLSEYVAPLLPIDPAEMPTAQELADYQSANPAIQQAAKAAIEAKAQAWYARNWANLGAALSAYISSSNIQAPAVIGARYYHEKLDSDHAGQTGVTQHYPMGITIQLRGGRRVHPDGDWERVQGVEYQGSTFIFSNISGPARLQIVGRHEAGHASDHVDFGTGHGTGDHCPAGSGGLMTPTGSSADFSDKGILRLRGWTP